MKQEREIGAGGELVVSEMLPSDLDEVLGIEEASFSVPWSRESFLFEIQANPYARNLVMRHGGRIVAFACAWVVDDELKINNIAVLPGERRKGYGEAMLRHVLDYGRSSACTEATLEVRPSNRAARALYETHGFEQVGRRKGYYRDTHEDAILMAAELGAGGVMDQDDAIRERLAREDEGYRRLAQKHQEYDRRLEELRGRRFLSDEEKVEEVRLKKLKLSTKDRMEEMVRERRREHGS
jgi:ribosomal-protein-alanine N-acetyltransferase